MNPDSDTIQAKDTGPAAAGDSGVRKNSSSSSIAVKLNMRMTGRLFAAISSINILLIIFSLIFIGWNAEKTVSQAARGMAEQPAGTGFYQYGIDKLTIAKTSVSLNGVTINESIYEPLMRDGVKGARMIGLLPADNDLLKGCKRVWALKYSLMTDVDGQSYRLVYSVGNDLRAFVIWVLVLFGLELIIIISESVKSDRIIRKTLRPIYDLAESTRVLNQELAAVGSKTEERQLEALAGVLSDIDANKLDRQISVDSTQDELKGLAAAINAMLRRINDSYQSQVQFVSDASHELRTPISVIQGYVNLLDRWGKKDEKTMQESIDAIKAETQNMKELVEQLLFLARGDNETIQLHRESFDACEMIEEIVREAEMIDSTHKFELDLKPPTVISADKQLIKQAIRILVDNSCKYTPRGETIRLKASADAENVRIAVQDNGIGIEPESLPLIFNRFYRSDVSRTRKTGGSGLGLSIAKWIVERHGAHFEIMSRVDIGTRITIVMPVENEPATVGEASAN